MLSVLEALRGSPLSPTERLVLLVVAKYIAAHGHCVQPASVLADYTGFTTKTIGSALRTLVARGVLVAVPSEGTATEYLPGRSFPGGGKEGSPSVENPSHPPGKETPTLGKNQSDTPGKGMEGGRNSSGGVSPYKREERERDPSGLSRGTGVVVPFPPPQKESPPPLPPPSLPGEDEVQQLTTEAALYWGEHSGEPVHRDTQGWHLIAAAVRQDLAAGDSETTLDAMRWFWTAPEAQWNRDMRHGISTIYKHRAKYASFRRKPAKKRANASDRGYHPDVIAPTLTDEEYTLKAASLWDPLK